MLIAQNEERSENFLKQFRSANCNFCVTFVFMRVSVSVSVSGRGSVCGDEGGFCPSERTCNLSMISH